MTTMTMRDLARAPLAVRHEVIRMGQELTEREVGDLARERAKVERTRLEARLAEVEARYEANRRDWARLTEQANENARASLEAYDRLRTAVRPLVEAARALVDDCVEARAPYECDHEAATDALDAALADPAIAALLDQQKEQGVDGPLT